MRSTMILALAFSFPLAACGTSQYDQDPLYDAGFSDGCSTGTARTPGTPASKADRDQALWDQSDAYRAGWRAGYGSCSPGRNEIPGDR